MQATTVTPQLQVLGTFDLRVGRTPASLPLQAQRLLGLLSLDGRARPRTQLAGRLWGDVTQQQAQANLRNALWHIRRRVDGVVRCSRHSVELSPTVSIDLERARATAQAVLRGSCAPELRLIGILDHDLLPEWDEDWLLIEREQQRQLRMHALEALSASLSAAGHHAGAIAAALAAVRAEPLRESGQQAVIDAHIAEDNITEAVRQLESYRRLLADELGLPPGERLTSTVSRAIASVRRRARVITPGS